MSISGDLITMKLLYLGIFLVGSLTDGIECCGTGYYSSNGNCKPCPNNCATCETGSLCTICYTGYFGETCFYTCPSLCHNNECNRILGECLSCKQGYFMDGNKTCKKCPENCITCESNNVCFECRIGYKGEYCQDVCISCKTGTSCDKKDGYCFDDCIDGLSGVLCDKPCNSKCKTCNRFKQNECNTCAPDRYGPSCNPPCSNSCAANACDAVNGVCKLGCKHGFWGELCEKECSLECINKVCDHVTGNCKEGCIEGNDGIDCKTRTDIRNMPGMIGGITGGVLSVIGIAVLVACFVYIFIKRKRRNNSSIPEIEINKAEKKSPGHDKDYIYARPTNQEIVNLDLEKLLPQPNHDKNVKDEITLTFTIESQADNLVKDTDTKSTKISSLSSVEKKDDTKLSQDIEGNIDGQVCTLDDNQEELDLIIPIFEKMNNKDKPTNNSIKVTELAKYVAAKSPSILFKEFQTLLRDVKGTKLSGRASSRMQCKVPQIRQPVVLEDACKASDYINANFIDGGFNDSKAYIAYMGSVANTSDDMEVFWKVVWQESCSTVLMLGTRSLPEDKCTCTNEPCSVVYHDLTVECHGEEKMASFTVRKYTLRKHMMEREVQRLQFCEWPFPPGLPDVSSFVEFVNYANKIQTLDGPTLVYCRYGIECTGTYIALDILTKQGKDTGRVDIQGCVRHLLEQRVNMLHNDRQYAFLHKALVCSLTSEYDIEAKV